MTTTSLNPDEVNLNGDVVIDVPKESLFYAQLNIEDDIRQTEALESVIDDLYYLTESIVGASGINQTFALEAEQLLPGKNKESTELWWERNFYPDVSMIINDLHSKGLLPAGDYSIDIDW